MDFVRKTSFNHSNEKKFSLKIDAAREPGFGFAFNLFCVSVMSRPNSPHINTPNFFACHFATLDSSVMHHFHNPYYEGKPRQGNVYSACFYCFHVCCLCRNLCPACRMGYYRVPRNRIYNTLYWELFFLQTFRT